MRLLHTFCSLKRIRLYFGPVVHGSNVRNLLSAAPPVALPKEDRKIRNWAGSAQAVPLKGSAVKRHPRPQAVRLYHSRRSQQRPRRLGRRVAVVGLFVFLLVFALVQFAQPTSAAGQSSSTGGRETAAAEPVRPLRLTLYEQAAMRYRLSPAMLRALHQVESSSSPGGCLLNLQGSGAVGPFQFMRDTFRVYGVDGDGDGRVDICGLADSLFSAAHYLQVLGADADAASAATRHALKRYGTDPARVIALATAGPTTRR
jgi:hypothetical protein